MTHYQRHIRYDSERDKTFPAAIKSMPGCEDLDRCIQCGTCSATCPVSVYMDLTPRKIIHLTRSGFKKDVLHSFTIWLCASCYACTADCPKEIKITDIMYALKQRAIGDKVYPKRFPIPVLSREFLKMVRSKGRVTENWLALSLFLKTQIMKLFGMQKLGLRLISTGRFCWKYESMENPEELTKILDSLDEMEGGAKQ